MKRIIYIFALCLMPTLASGEEVIDLPEMSGNWYLTAVYTSVENPTVRDRELHQILRKDPRLVKLINQVTFTEWDSNSEFVNKSVWKNYLGTNRPAILLQTPATADGTGSVVYFASGPHLKTNGFLAESISAAVNNFVKTGGCPRCPQPEPEPYIPPVTPNIPQTVPDVDVDVTVPDPPRQEETEETPLLLILLGPILGAGFGLYQSIKKENSV